MKLYTALQKRIQQAHWRFHVPGHAGQPLANHSVFSAELFQADVTELPGLDVLGQPEGVLAELQSRIAKTYNTQHSFCLINGASVGLMASLLSLPQPSKEPGQILISRNAHRSVVHGLILSGHTPVWILPESHPEWGIWGAVCLDTVKTHLSQNSDIQAVVLTHPTYEGVSSPIHDIAALCHAHGIPLIIDEAHGSLWPLFDDLPTSAIQAGADIVVHSLHKSAGALTQCALLHVNHGSLISPERVQQALNTLQTTSPSYPLLLSIEETVLYWTSPGGQIRAEQHIEMCNSLRTWIRSTLEHTHIAPVGSEGFQLLLKHDYLSAEDLATQLEDQHGIAFESVNDQSVFLHLNPGLVPDAFEALKTALLALDSLKADIHETSNALDEQFKTLFTLPETVLTPRDAFLSPGEKHPISNALGRVSRELIATCPPGIAILMPGERIQAEHLALLPDDSVIEVLNSGVN